jgi:DNA-binding YbaB/EbfC family protein
VAKNMNKLLKQAQQMQAQMMKAQEKLKETEVEGSAGGGMVKVRMNGSQEVLGVTINPEVVDPSECEMLEDLIVAAIKGAQDKVAELTSSAMGSVTGGINIPGMM